jgi:hypothetical protein
MEDEVKKGERGCRKGMSTVEERSKSSRRKEKDATIGTM